MRKRDIARYIMKAIPRNAGGGKKITAEQLALVLLLESEKTLTVTQIKKIFNIPISIASYLVSDMIENGRIEKTHSFDQRETTVKLAPRSHVERQRARGKRKGSEIKPVAPLLYGPTRSIIEKNVKIENVGRVDKLECGHMYIRHPTKTNPRSKNRYCGECKKENPNVKS